ncbi:DegV family protein [Cytobacillus solani]|uniref:Fatty acid-binding protein DegV n=1 Tax=Cytobacillus solani TaxID=1637975 RepID=A0A0Q3QKZ0_9BACI|nr:DegV family protein [Cytobacillus solani]KOP81703.1 fatty acid-binding protein DegV [Bacillus sp. FJAT-21945]KQL18641.1 fatty acid-binding protein DegV [Cytobacillus solani]USK56623.1 DegV family protein [Cytobacillus solani]
MSVKILTDSASDLPLSFYEENNVTLLPLKVHLDDTEYVDLLTIDSKKVYQAIREGKVPKTSQVSPQVFEEAFTKMAENGEDGIYIAFSSELSGTYQTAVMMLDQVKEAYPDFKLTIIDTKCASLGFGLIVKEAARLAKENTTKEDILKDIEFRCQHMEHLFTVHDLDYLAKGGRVSRASAFLGGLLNIKPLLNVEDGKLVPIEKHRGKKKLLRRIIEIMKERGQSLDQQIIGISHADDEETAIEMKELIKQEFNTKEFYISSIGSAIGSHTGSGTIAIFFLNKVQS